jgi:hypothetical protein
MRDAPHHRQESTGHAEDLAIQALGFLASDPELLPRFLALTGIEANQIREAAGEPGFLAGVLGFFLAHEPSLLKLTEALGVKPVAIEAAARALPAGDDRFEHST